MSTKRALVTGAGGFIGRWAVPALLRRGYEVHAVLSPSGKPPPEEIAGAVIHRVDLKDAAATRTLVDAVRPSHLLHFAWIATPGLYWTSPENAEWLAATEALARAFIAAGGQRLVAAGSCAEYDWSRAGICHEFTTPLADAGPTPPLPYIAAKLACQRTLAALAAETGASFAWGRIFFQYGPHEHPDRLVASVIRHLLAGEEALCTHGRQVRSFLHVADVGDAFAALLDSAVEGPVNIGSDEAVTLAELIGMIAERIGRPDLVRMGAREAPANEPAVLLPDVGRLRDEVGWRPRFDISAGLDSVILK